MHMHTLCNHVNLCTRETVLFTEIKAKETLSHYSGYHAYPITAVALLELESTPYPFSLACFQS